MLRETDPSTVTEHGLYERPVAKMPDEVMPLLSFMEGSVQCYHTDWAC